MWEFFTTKVKPGMDVLVYVSTTGTGEYYGQVFSHTGKFEKVAATEAEVAELRPESALAGDTGHGCYWVVSDFNMLKEEEFIKFSDMKVSYPLLGPRVS